MENCTAVLCLKIGLQHLFDFSANLGKVEKKQVSNFLFYFIFKSKSSYLPD